MCTSTCNTYSVQPVRMPLQHPPVMSACVEHSVCWCGPSCSAQRTVHSLVWHMIVGAAQQNVMTLYHSVPCCATVCVKSCTSKVRTHRLHNIVFHSTAQYVPKYYNPELQATEHSDTYSQQYVLVLPQYVTKLYLCMFHLL